MYRVLYYSFCLTRPFNATIHTSVADLANVYSAAVNQSYQRINLFYFSQTVQYPLNSMSRSCVHRSYFFRGMDNNLTSKDKRH